MSEKKSALRVSGLDDEEAQEFHGYFMRGFIGFTILAFFAHVLVAVLWRWPWFPKEDGTYGSIVNGVKYAATQLSQFIA